MTDKWHEWETSWRTYEIHGVPYRMRIEYGFDKVNRPPMFHAISHSEEKLRNNRWVWSGSHVKGAPDPFQLFPELEFIHRWDDFWPLEEPHYLETAKFYWEYAHGVRKPGQYDDPDAVERAPARFAKHIFFGNLPDDDIGPADPESWPSTEAWLLQRHPRLIEAFNEAYGRLPVNIEGTGQQATVRLLPPGVRRVITANKDRIQAAVEGRILWDKILGCGHYGCVFPIDGTGRVLKVSTDTTEGPVIQAIIDTGLDKELAGLVPYHAVWQIPDYEGRGARATAYAIVRDEIQPVQIDVMRTRWIEVLNAYNVAAGREITLKKDFMIRMAREQAEKALQKLYNWHETYYVAEAIEQLRADGIILSDVHMNNLGSGVQSPVVSWSDGTHRPALLIFDPGHSKVPPTEVRMLP